MGICGVGWQPGDVGGAGAEEVQRPSTLSLDRKLVFSFYSDPQCSDEAQPLCGEQSVLLTAHRLNVNFIQKCPAG